MSRCLVLAPVWRLSCWRSEGGHECRWHGRIVELLWRGLRGCGGNGTDQLRSMLFIRVVSASSVSSATRFLKRTAA